MSPAAPRRLATSSSVNAAIKQIALTRILVAHRPETIAMAQRVIVVDQGRVVRDLEQQANPGGLRSSTDTGGATSPAVNGHAVFAETGRRFSA